MPAKRCACPMAMPPDTPMPCIVKLTLDAGPVMSFAFAELVGEEFLDGVGRLLLVGAVGLDLDHGAQARRQHHHAHDAFRVHAPAVARDPHLARELPRGLRELRRSARMQPQLVGDLDRALDHAGIAGMSMRRTPSVAPESAFSMRLASGSSR